MSKLNNFEGPLDLLLQLIERQELNITEISLSQVTEQFFAYLDKLEKNHSSELADFLVIAAKLIYLKSKNLLPYLYPDEEESGQTLTDQLKMYKTYVDASVNIQNLWKRDRIAYGRDESPLKMSDFIVPRNARVEDLKISFEQLLKRLKPIQPLPEATIDHAVSIKQTIDNIMAILKQNKKFSFIKLLNDSKNRTEIIVSFLAILDLLKKKDIIVRQINSFADMEVERI